MRPEYLTALEWARWNYWFIAMWVVPVIIICAASRSWKLAIVALPIAIVACFILFFLGVEYYWNVKSQIAVTDAEWEDVTSDAGRLYGPILVGPPFAVIYCSVLALAINPAVWIYSRFARRSSVAKSSGNAAA